MRILLDEDVPVQVLEILRRVVKGHDVDHVEALHWKGKKDEFLVADAAGKGYDLLLTNNRRQLSDPRECGAIKKSRMHHVLYDQAPGVARIGSGGRGDRRRDADAGRGTGTGGRAAIGSNP